MTGHEKLYSLHDNGTLTDDETGITWMLPMLGQNWKNNKVVGRPFQLDWLNATESYGRGKQVKPPNSKEFWEVTDRSPPWVCSDTYEEYKRGRSFYPFAGFTDWRMPTVEEWFSLYLKLPEKTSETIFLPEMTLNKGRFWCANSTKPSFFSRFSKESHSYLAEGSVVFADAPTTYKCNIRMIRGGRLYDLYMQHYS